jgi:hypothetical protein
MARIPILLLLVGALLLTLVSAGAPTFCKCTCFKNSTIIPLGAEHQNTRFDHGILAREFEDPAPRALPVGGHDDRRSASSSCSECTKSFCLSQGIDFCKNATEDDVVTMCFKRDSNKDKIIVWGFIFGTVGLLGWAAFKHANEWRQARAAAYAPLSR